MFSKSFFHWMGVRAHPGTRKRKGLAPHSMKKAFWNHFKCENSFCKKSRNLSWVGADFSSRWLNFPKNEGNFVLFEFWSGCRCDMKIIFGVFDNLDIKLLSHKNFCHHLLCMFLQIGLKVKNAKKNCEKNFKKSSNESSVGRLCLTEIHKKIKIHVFFLAFLSLQKTKSMFFELFELAKN